MVNRLISGFADFRNEFFEDDSVFFSRLVSRGQTPETMVISCSDSRVDPAILFNTRPGELFMVRNVANLVPPYAPDDGHHGVSAAIEFGVKDLKVKHIIILGHAHCGGISALCKHCLEEPLSDRDFVNSWIQIARPAMDKIGNITTIEEAQHPAEQASIAHSLRNLESFPWVRQAIIDNRLAMHGWWFDMDAGTLWTYDSNADTFHKHV